MLRFWVVERFFSSCVRFLSHFKKSGAASVQFFHIVRGKCENVIVRILRIDSVVHFNHLILITSSFINCSSSTFVKKDLLIVDWIVRISPYISTSSTFARRGSSFWSCRQMHKPPGVTTFPVCPNTF